MSTSGDVLLCDFGLSRYAEEIRPRSRSSSPASAGGSLRFMAPELLTQICTPTPESDVFAFASLMLQVITLAHSTDVISLNTLDRYILEDHHSAIYQMLQSLAKS